MDTGHIIKMKDMGSNKFPTYTISVASAYASEIQENSSKPYGDYVEIDLNGMPHNCAVVANTILQKIKGYNAPDAVFNEFKGLDILHMSQKIISKHNEKYPDNKVEVPGIKQLFNVFPDTIRSELQDAHKYGN